MPDRRRPDQMVEDAEIDGGRLALYAAQAVDLGGDQRAAGGVGQPPLGERQQRRERRRWHRLAMIPQGAANDGPLVGGLGGHDAPDDDNRARGGVVGDVRNCVRRSSTLPVRAPSTRARNRPFGSQVRYGHARFGAGGQQCWRCTRRGKADNAVQQVQRRAAASRRHRPRPRGWRRPCAATRLRL